MADDPACTVPTGSSLCPPSVGAMRGNSYLGGFSLVRGGNCYFRGILVASDPLGPPGLDEPVEVDLDDHVIDVGLLHDALARHGLRSLLQGVQNASLAGAGPRAFPALHGLLKPARARSYVLKEPGARVGLDALDDIP